MIWILHNWAVGLVGIRIIAISRPESLNLLDERNNIMYFSWKRFQIKQTNLSIIFSFVNLDQKQKKGKYWFKFTLADVMWIALWSIFDTVDMGLMLSNLSATINSSDSSLHRKEFQGKKIKIYNCHLRSSATRQSTTLKSRVVIIHHSLLFQTFTHYYSS